MERISFTIPKHLLERLNDEVRHWQTGNLRDNRAAYIRALVERALPE